MKFLDFSVACSAVRAAMAARQEKVCFTIDRTAVGRRSKAAVRDVLTDVLEYAASYNIQITEDDGEMQIAIDAVHRPALRMLDAWETGDRAALTDEENACLNKALNTVQQCRKHARSALDVELAIAQAICGAVDYAKEAVAQNMRTTAYLRASTCIGALMDGTAQCQGYAETFYLLGKLAGLDVETQYGWASEGSGKHAWNTIRLGRNTYITDVCWMDSQGNAFTPEAADYRYFNIALDAMPAGRRWHPEAEAAAISEKTDPARTAFAAHAEGVAICKTLEDAAEFSVQCHQKGIEFAQIWIPDTLVSVDDASRAVWDAIRKCGIPTRWGRLARAFAGGTYITVRWVFGERFD